MTLSKGTRITTPGNKTAGKGGFAIVDSSMHSTATPMEEDEDFNDTSLAYFGPTLTSGPPVYYIPRDEKPKPPPINRGHKNVSPKRVTARRKKNKARRQARRRTKP